jgi:hypothetical protein
MKRIAEPRTDLRFREDCLQFGVGSDDEGRERFLAQKLVFIPLQTRW